MGAPSNRPLPPSQFVRPQPPQSRPAQITRPYVGQQPPTTQGLRGGAGLDAEKEKEEQIRALEAELSNLRTQLTTAKGEANLMRSKYDRDVPQLKQKMAEEKAKMEKKLQEALEAQQAVSNELQFANADLQERGRPRTKKPGGKDGALTPGGRNKTKFMQMSDGFSEVEVLGVGSPSRDRAGRREWLRDQGKNGNTPTKGKRKRPTVDSPSFALETETDGGVFEDGGSYASRPGGTRSGPTLPYDVSLQHLPTRELDMGPLTSFFATVPQTCPRPFSSPLPSSDFRSLCAILLPIQTFRVLRLHHIPTSSPTGRVQPHQQLRQ